MQNAAKSSDTRTDDQERPAIDTGSLGPWHGLPWQVQYTPVAPTFRCLSVTEQIVRHLSEGWTDSIE